MPARVPFRCLLAVAACAAGVAQATGCGGGAAAPAADRTPPATFANAYLTFRHPATWTAYPFRWSGELHFQPMLYVSTQPVHDPCRTRNGTVTCGWPVDHLLPGGVLVTVENRGFPGWTLADAAGNELRVGGRPAKRSVDRPGACGSIAGEVTVEVAVASPEADNWTEVTACLRGPQLEANERSLDRLLASIRFE